MHTVTTDRVIARNDNIVLVGFSRKPEPPAPRFPGAGGLRKVSHPCDIRFRQLAYRRSEFGFESRADRLRSN
jgi:hypothetical protein